MGIECLTGLLKDFKEFQETYREINPRYVIFSEREIDEEKLPPGVKVIKASAEEFNERMIHSAWEIVWFDDRLKRNYSYCPESETIKAMQVIDKGATKAKSYMNVNNMQRLSTIFEPKRGSTEFDYLDTTIACLERGIETRQAQEDAKRTQEYYRTSKGNMRV